MFGQDGVCFGAINLAEGDVPPANFASVCLQLDWALCPKRILAVPVVLPAGMIDHELVIKEDGSPFADLADLKTVPLPEWLVGQDERILARGTRAIVPETA